MLIVDFFLQEKCQTSNMRIDVLHHCELNGNLKMSPWEIVMCIFRDFFFMLDIKLIKEIITDDNTMMKIISSPRMNTVKQSEHTKYPLPAAAMLCSEKRVACLVYTTSF